jgi:ribose transport system permease protein
MRDYGMFFVLLLLVVLFSSLTIRLQQPTGADAGRQVADMIVARDGAQARVLIITRNTAGDRAFASAVAARLKEQGATVLANVNGGAADARKAIASLVAAGKTIDAIAANNVTAKWTVYDHFPAVGSAKCVIPRPYLWPDFLKLSNLEGVATQTAIYAIIAIGMTMVIITGGIDLSVGSLVALAAVSCAVLIRDIGGGESAGVGMVAAGCLVGIGLCALAGLYNGVMITAFDLPPFIVTLGLMWMGRGLPLRISDGQSISQLPAAFFWIGKGEIFDVPNPIVLMVVLYIIAHVVMSRTVFGRYVYAIGGNAEAARLSGVPVRRILVAVYTICGALAGLGGIVLASQLSAGDPKYGDMYELEVIAAVVVGGTSLMGGQGKIFGTIIGAFIIAVIKNGMNLTGVDPFNQMIVLGAVLTAAVLLDALKRRQFGR